MRMDTRPNASAGPKTLLLEYDNRAGKHCGSTAMRNLLQHYCGLDLREEDVFGLGSAIDCMVLEDETVTPAAMIFGRGITMEVDIASALEVGYSEEVELDDDKAWHAVHEELLAGRPTMLSGDALYLEYKFSNVHFPAHRFVLVGYDPRTDEAVIADRLVSAAQRTSLASLRECRNPRGFLSTYNLWGRFHDDTVGRAFPEACLHALTKTVGRMTGEDESQGQFLALMAPSASRRVTTGLAGLSRLQQLLETWMEREARADLSSYLSLSIEKFGTGGGQFRGMFASFLRSCHRAHPGVVPPACAELADRSAAHWTTMADELRRFAKDDEPARIEACRREMGEIIVAETELVGRLADALGA